MIGNNMLYDWTTEKIYGVLVFIGATLLSVKQNIIGNVLVIKENPFTFEVINTIVKGIINSIFAILVAAIIHYIKKKGGIGNIIKEIINYFKKILKNERNL